ANCRPETRVPQGAEDLLIVRGPRSGPPTRHPVVEERLPGSSGAIRVACLFTKRKQHGQIVGVVSPGEKREHRNGGTSENDSVTSGLRGPTCQECFLSGGP